MKQVPWANNSKFGVLVSKSKEEKSEENYDEDYNALDDRLISLRNMRMDRSNEIGPEIKTNIEIPIKSGGIHIYKDVEDNGVREGKLLI